MLSYQKATPYFFLALPLFLLAVFFFWPLLHALWMSLHDYSHTLYAPPFVGLKNYQSLWTSPRFWQSVGNTLWLTVGILPAMITLPIVLALLVNGQGRLLNTVRTVLYLPVVVSMVVAGLAWKWLYAHDGLINQCLGWLHLPAVDWLIDPNLALAAVAIVIVWKGLAYYMMMYLAQLQSVSADLYEVAKLEGANAWQTHWYVTLPHLRPTMILVALISTIGALKVFTEIYVMTGGGPMGKTQTIVYYLYERAFSHLDLGVATAVGIVLMVVLMVLTVLQLRLNRWAESAFE